jgi:CMP-N,N'-diacetyllegionaminic acid synthase
MISGKTVLIYIPARSGSKSIIDKNIVDVCGKPLIAYSIEVGKKSKYVDRIIVSTDSEKYADIAKEYGAESPFLRPDELASDNAVEIDVIIHLMKWLEEHEGKKYDIVVKLEPTSALRLAEDVDKAIEKLIEKDSDSVVSVSESLTHPYWMNTLPDDHSMKDFIRPDALRKNRQELPVFYQLDGVVYVAKWDAIKDHRTWLAGNCFATITPEERAIDVDGPIQLEIVKILIGQRRENE